MPLIPLKSGQIIAESNNRIRTSGSPVSQPCSAQYAHAEPAPAGRALNVRGAAPPQID